MTYLELVNEVLRRLREDTVTTVSQTTYSTMIGDIVNDAKTAVESAWDWSALRGTISFNTTADDATYSLSGTTDQLKVIPNPSSDVIEIQGVSGEFRIELYDVTGKFLNSFTEKTIDLSFCSKGLYMLNISNQHSSRILRVMMK